MQVTDENKTNSSHFTIRADIVLNAQFDRAFIIMNALAAIIASYALLADSVSGVIGAMLVAMLLGPIVGVSLSLVDGDNMLLKQSSLALFGGAAIIMFFSFIIGFIHSDMPISHEMLARTNPNYLDLMIALAGGAVGAYAVITPRIPNAIVGVAIATALVPPLCTGTIFLARGDWEHAFGAYLLSGTNIVAIQFASSIILWIFGFHKVMDRFNNDKKIIWLNSISIALMVLLFLMLSANTKLLIDKITYETKVRDVLISQLDQYPGAHIGEVRIDSEDGKTIIRTVVRSPNSFSAANVAAIESKLPESKNRSSVELRLRHVKVVVMTKDGPIFDDDMTRLSENQ